MWLSFFWLSFYNVFWLNKTSNTFERLNDESSDNES